MRRQELGRGVVGIDLDFDHPGGSLDIVAYATESAVVSYRAVCSIIGAKYDGEIDRLLAHVETLQEQATPPKPDDAS
jgi:hypothetical protein